MYTVENITNDSQTWAYPTISKAFYDPLSHKIGTECLVISFLLMEFHVSPPLFFSVVPLSLILVPYFHQLLPPYLHYSTVGTTIAKGTFLFLTFLFFQLGFAGLHGMRKVNTYNPVISKQRATGTVIRPEISRESSQNLKIALKYSKRFIDFAKTFQLLLNFYSIC